MRTRLPGPTPALLYRTYTRNVGPKSGRVSLHTTLRMRNTMVVKGWSVGWPLYGGSPRLRWRLLGTLPKDDASSFCLEGRLHALRGSCEGISLLSPAISALLRHRTASVCHGADTAGARDTGLHAPQTHSPSHPPLVLLRCEKFNLSAEASAATGHSILPTIRIAARYLCRVEAIRPTFGRLFLQLLAAMV